MAIYLPFTVKFTYYICLSINILCVYPVYIYLCINILHHLTICNSYICNDYLRNKFKTLDAKRAYLPVYQQSNFFKL